jgi:peptidoglycan hydrolase-like protein with peptidoglycan-binding domain
MADEPDMAPGTENDWVSYLQQMLEYIGLYDGSYGERTQASVAALQEQYSIDEGGVVGTQTWKLLAMSREQPAEGATYESVDSSVDTVEAPEFEEEGTA